MEIGKIRATHDIIKYALYRKMPLLNNELGKILLVPE